MNLRTTPASAMKPLRPLVLAVCLLAALPVRAAEDVPMKLFGSISKIELVKGALVVTFSGTMFHSSSGPAADHFGFAARVDDLRITLENPAASGFFEDAPSRLRSLDTPEAVEAALARYKGRMIPVLLHCPVIRFAQKGIVGASAASMEMAPPAGG